MEFEVGDLVQLNGWFGDVWAEVINVGCSYFTYICYAKGGLERWSWIEAKTRIRKVVKKSDIPEKKIGVYFLQQEYFGSFGRHKYWGYDVSERYSSNYPEIFKEQ